MSRNSPALRSAGCDECTARHYRVTDPNAAYNGTGLRRNGHPAARSQTLQQISALRLRARHTSRSSVRLAANGDPFCQCDFSPCATDTACALACDAARLARNPPPCSACSARNPARNASRLAGRSSRLSFRLRHWTPPRIHCLQARYEPPTAHVCLVLRPSPGPKQLGESLMNCLGVFRIDGYLINTATRH